MRCNRKKSLNKEKSRKGTSASDDIVDGEKMSQGILELSIKKNYDSIPFLLGLMISLKSLHRAYNIPSRYLAVLPGIGNRYSNNME